jgi:hypothetical protein
VIATGVASYTSTQEQPPAATPPATQTKPAAQKKPPAKKKPSKKHARKH